MRDRRVDMRGHVELPRVVMLLHVKVGDESGRKVPRYVASLKASQPSLEM